MERIKAKGKVNIRGLKILMEIVCSKIELNIKEKITGLGFWEPIPMLSGVSNRAKAEKKIILFNFEEKKVERI